MAKVDQSGKGVDERERILLSSLLLGIADHSASTRADLARLTRLAPSTVSQRIDGLKHRGLVVEERGAQSTGGRPPTVLSLNGEAGVVLAADLGATSATLAVSDLGGRQLLRKTMNDFDITQGPTAVLGQVDEQLARLLVQAGRGTEDVTAIAIGVPGPVEHPCGRVVRPPIMPGWDNYRIPAYFEDRYDVPVLVDNDVNLMASGECQARGIGDLLFIKAGTGIGCGIVSNGAIHRGAQGAAGDIGHIQVPGQDSLCDCGNRGCLEAVAGGAALACNLADADTRTSRDVARLAANGDRYAREAVRTASQHIGNVLAALVNFYNPSMIVIGGSLAELDELLLAGIRSRIQDRALPLATKSLPIELSQLGVDAGINGAVLLAQRYLFSPHGLPALLRRRP